MLHKRPVSVRREQKKSLYKREFSKIFQVLSEDVSELISLVVTRVEISADSGVCYIHFSSFKGEDAYKEGLEQLKLYKGSLRRALAKKIRTRYVPELVFCYDEELEEQRHIEALLDSVKSDSNETTESSSF